MPWAGSDSRSGKLNNAVPDCPGAGDRDIVIKDARVPVKMRPGFIERLHGHAVEKDIGTGQGRVQNEVMPAVEGNAVLHQGELPAKFKGIAAPADDLGGRVQAL
jgi:hypothetical protein